MGTYSSNGGAANILSNNETTMINFIRRKLYNWLRNDNDMVRPTKDSNSVRSGLSSREEINFSIIPASGGTLVKVQYYNERKDEHLSTMHIVTPDEDMADALAQILNITKLSK